jgi:hypothetical protein
MVCHAREGRAKLGDARRSGPRYSSWAICALMSGLHHGRGTPRSCVQSGHHWKALDSYNPTVEASMVDLMGGTAEKVYAALTVAGLDVLSRHGPG